MLSGPEFVLAGLASVAAGFLNALAGGGTLISFPVLVALGVSPIAANITNTAALCPGYLGASLSQISDLGGQSNRLRRLAPAAALGGILGALLLVNTGERTFRAMIPYLILLASVLLALQEPLRKRLLRGEPKGAESLSDRWAVLPVGVAAVYGGYFGAGLSVIFLAVLGLLVEESLTRLNAVKQTLALITNVTAALFFVFSGQVIWSAALVMAAGALAGGYLGGRLAGRINSSLLRVLVVVIGVAVSIVYFVRS